MKMEGAYYKTKASVEEYIRMAQDVSGKQLIDKLNHFLSPNSNVLEIGSGPGTDWKILNESYTVTGSDNSTEFLTHLKHDNPNGDFIPLDATSLLTNTRFDGIYSNKVLHHLTNKELASSIRRQYEILNPHGIICHSFWKGSGSEVFKGLFVNYHSKIDLKMIFTPYFEILSLENYLEFEADDSILLIGKKK